MEATLIPHRNSLTPAETTYVTALFNDSKTGLSCNHKGDLFIKQRGQIRPIGYVYFANGVMQYIQPEKEDHRLKGWNAWTIDKVIFQALPDNAHIVYSTELAHYIYTKHQINLLKEDTLSGKVTNSKLIYQEKVFQGHSNRIILSVLHAQILAYPK